MSQRISVTILPSSSHPEVLTVQDTMEHILDVFKLLKENNEVIWKLVEVSMQSPFIATAEAISFVPDVDIDTLAREQKCIFSTRLTNLPSGVVPDEWSYGDNFHVAVRLYQRNTNGIGKMIVDFHEEFPQITIVPTVADSAIKALQKVKQTEDISVIESDDSHKELGAVDGHLMQVAYHYNQPAIRIQDRLTHNDIWCIIPEKLHGELSSHAKIADVWSGKRIIVRGELQYNKSGGISRIIASEVEVVDSQAIPLKKILDKDFTDGLTAIEYLNRIRGQ